VNTTKRDALETLEHVEPRTARHLNVQEDEIDKRFAWRILHLDHDAHGVTEPYEPPGIEDAVQGGPSGSNCEERSYRLANG